MRFSVEFPFCWCVDSASLLASVTSTRDLSMEKKKGGGNLDFLGKWGHFFYLPIC